MTNKINKLRLDEILLMEGCISQEQITEALMRQKAHGGKFGTQLLYHRYVDESSLVSALTTQFSCEGVLLSDIIIDKDVIKMLPAKQAVARKIIPFEYDEKSNTLKIACGDPTDLKLINEINYLVRGKKNKLYVAAELAIEAAINKYYLGRDTNLNDNLSLELPDLAVADDLPVKPDDEKTKGKQEVSSNSVMLITDEEYSGSLYGTILERDKYDVVIRDSYDSARAIIEERSFQAILIKNSVSGDRKGLIDRLRKISPRTKIKFFKSSPSLLWDDQSGRITEAILKQNLDMFLSIIASRDNVIENHSGAVGRYAYKLCHRLGLPSSDQAIITNAAYFHDLAGYYHREIEYSDNASLIKETVKILKSFDYPRTITDMLDAMYKDLKTEYTKSLPLEILGGNILTIVDLFCENIQLNQKLTLEKFDAVKKQLREYSDKLLLPDIVEAFIGMVQDEILYLQTSSRVGQIMIYSNDKEASYPIELRLKNENFRIVSESTSKSLLNVYQRSRPDILVLAIKGGSDQVSKEISEFSQKGLDYKQTPTFLLVETGVISEFEFFFEKGIEDVIALDGNYDLLVVKLKKIQEKFIEEARRKKEFESQKTGARGRLSDMDLIDLMQALGPGRKTVKLTITAETPSEDKMIVYLKKGNISFAELNEKTGAEAIYEGMAWADGRWQIEQVEESDFPEPNNDLSNEAILMEGSYRLDEKLNAAKQ